jgi:hypothetical protein
MLTVALNLTCRDEEPHWETCPACGLMFETATQTKKIEMENPMQITITAEVTPENAPLLAQLLTGGTSTDTLSAAVTPTTPVIPASTPEPPDEPDPVPEAPADLATAIRAKCLDLKKAGKNDVARAAIKSVGYESLAKVPPEKYPDLWEVLRDVG